MKINIQFETSGGYNAERFKKFAEAIEPFAAVKDELFVKITDDEFICSDHDLTQERNTLKKVRKILREEPPVEEETEPEAEAPTEPEQSAEPPCDCRHDHGEENVSSKSVCKCKNCDQEFPLKKKSDKFCSPECRKEYFNHRCKSRAERAAEEEHREELECPVCGEKFGKHHPKQKCCSGVCQKLYTAWNVANKRNPIALKDFIEARDAKLAEKKRLTELKQRQCAYDQCGKMFMPTTEDQKYCSKECKAAAHQQRKVQKLVDVPEVPTGRYKHICEVCEQPFSDDGLVSKFCPKCLGTFGLQECIGLAEDTKARKLATTVVRPGQRQYKVCPKCGHSFDTIDPNQFFCDKCTTKALHQPKVKPLKPLEPEPIPPSD